MICSNKDSEQDIYFIVDYGPQPASLPQLLFWISVHSAIKCWC